MPDYTFLYIDCDGTDRERLAFFNNVAHSHGLVKHFSKCPCVVKLFDNDNSIQHVRWSVSNMASRHKVTNVRYWTVSRDSISDVKTIDTDKVLGKGVHYGDNSVEEDIEAELRRAEREHQALLDKSPGSISLKISS